jgi:hypothetical protein
MLNPTFDEIDDISPQELSNKKPEKQEQILQQIPLKNNIIPETQEREFKLQYPVGIMKVKVLDNNKFLFHDYNNIFIGQYTIDDMINYILENTNKTLILDQTNQPQKIDVATKKLIELTICKASNEEDVFKLNTTSPFMNDIELLMILNKMFKNFETYQIHKFVTANDYRSLKIIRKFIYSFIEHTINIVSIISKQLTDGNDETLKNKLMRYSIGLVYKLTQYLNSEITSSETKYKSMLSTVESLRTIEDKMESEITNFCGKK